MPTLKLTVTKPNIPRYTVRVYVGKDKWIPNDDENGALTRTQTMPEGIVDIDWVVDGGEGHLSEYKVNLKSEDGMMYFEKPPKGSKQYSSTGTKREEHPKKTAKKGVRKGSWNFQLKEEY